jgi:hypothetical protein
MQPKEGPEKEIRIELNSDPNDCEKESTHGHYIATGGGREHEATGQLPD